ncbi:MAG: aminotransferase class V-fold PLP-dependent enzyme [Spirochaetaceae bacterium]|nr:aminotransferase class V-fold PLP-dependent enzyme [Spirochaetaceae bacterium]
MIYANYAATSPALSPAAARELCAYAGGTHLNAGRNFEGLEAGAAALRARRAVAALFGIADPLRVILTSGATAALNMAIHGLARPRCRVLATCVEHNAAARPLQALAQSGLIALDWLTCDCCGSLDSAALRAALTSEPRQERARLLVMTHASNVLGTILPAAECYAVAREHGVLTILDAAQTGGVLPFTMNDCCDLLVFAGHKGLGGLAGTGGFVLGERAVREMRPWLRGGTGSASASLDMPDFLPDKFEPGTQNTAGALCLAAAVEGILCEGTAAIRERERALTARFLAGLCAVKKARVFGTRDAARSVAVVSLVIEGSDSGDVSRRLFEQHGIVTRSGLHCSPLAHTTAGTFPAGTVRFSFGSGTTEAEIDAILEALSAF